MNLDFTHRTGNTFSDVPFQIKLELVPIDLTGTTISMVLRREQGGEPQLTWTDTNGITITSAINGQFKIDSQIISLAPWNYFYDIVFTFPGPIVKTYVSGNFNITY